MGKEIIANLIALFRMLIHIEQGLSMVCRQRRGRVGMDCLVALLGVLPVRVRRPYSTHERIHKSNVRAHDWRAVGFKIGGQMQWNALNSARVDKYTAALKLW
jgi:hypothetical protein